MKIDRAIVGNFERNFQMVPEALFSGRNSNFSNVKISRVYCFTSIDCMLLFISGVQIVGPLRGSIRGIVGYVETTVENFDLLIDAERLRSMSSPDPSVHQVQRH